MTVLTSPTTRGFPSLTRKCPSQITDPACGLVSRRAHSKTVGGIPVASDVFLFQKQQHFNRSKQLERMVHPCGSGAFGYFECTKDVTSLTVSGYAQVMSES